MGLYDINGNDIPVNVSDAAVKAAIISGVASGEIELPTQTTSGTLSVAGLSDAWIANAEAAYALMLAKMRELGNSAIPWFIQTDQHGRGGTAAKWVHNKDKRVKNIALGDVVSDYFNEGQLTSFYETMRPVANKICVYGNHDIWTKSTEEANYYDLTKWFPSDGRKMVDEHGYFSVTDDEFRVKYLVVSPYYINLETGNNGADITIKTAQMTWLLEEMSKDDGYDIIILMHQLFTDTHYNRDGTNQTWADAPTICENFWTVMKDRRNKRSGTITDGEGVSHNYDFTNAKTKILCSLHGHSHEELMLTEDSMTAYAANWLGADMSCAFGLVDRKNSAMYVWQFGNSYVSDVLTLAI